MVDLKYEMDGLIPPWGSKRSTSNSVNSARKMLFNCNNLVFLGRLFVEEGASSDSLSLASDFRALFVSFSALELRCHGLRAGDRGV